mmetsp:Transcript_15442/g.22764  ORF Transcript_15442/g.22764 Transcript_15442/m.22764 type:complete len:154 (-) Transcript_15442:304-765(-)
MQTGGARTVPNPYRGQVAETLMPYVPDESTVVTIRCDMTYDRPPSRQKSRNRNGNHQKCKPKRPAVLDFSVLDANASSSSDSSTPSSPTPPCKYATNCAAVPVLVSCAPHKWYDLSETQLTVILLVCVVLSIAILAARLPSDASSGLRLPWNE